MEVNSVVLDVKFSVIVPHSCKFVLQFRIRKTSPESKCFPAIYSRLEMANGVKLTEPAQFLTGERIPIFAQTTIFLG